MSIAITSKGVLDTIQDLGRVGHRHLGINPNGAMDPFSAALANALIGKRPGAAVLELHYPASSILFEKTTVIAITGADFNPSIDGNEVPLYHAIHVRKNSQLKFNELKEGARCYVAILHDLNVQKWLGSYSTNIIAKNGGFEGRRLFKGDRIHLKHNIKLKQLNYEESFHLLPWGVPLRTPISNEIEFVMGSEWNWLTNEAQDDFQHLWFQLNADSNRMGFRLNGPLLTAKQHEQLISSAVCFGTVQLLPDERLVILMADHQTCGGYPRVAHVISADLTFLGQKRTNDVVHFIQTDLERAELKLKEQKKYITQIQNECSFKMKEYISN